MPRLTRSPGWWAIAWLAALACGVLFLWTVPPLDDSHRLFPWLPPGATRALAALAIVVVASIIGAIRPRWGAAPMIALGGVAITGLVAFAVVEDRQGPIWPVFLAGAAFLYLWWLAALLFDLVVVWHLYIRSSLINTHIRAMMSPAAGGKGEAAAA